MACEICYQITYNQCGGDFDLELALDANTSYTLLVQNNQTGLYYSYAVTSDADGTLTWPEVDHPQGLFVPFNGPFTATILSNGDPVTFTIGYDEYECAEFEFFNTTTITPTP